MKKALHGGNIHAAARTLGTSPRHILDLSASINPLGMPQSVRAAITSQLNAAVHYPDPDCVELSQELGAHHSITPDMILCGNGSTELIYLIARALQPEQILIPAPTFAEYERAIKASGKWEAGSKKYGTNYLHLKANNGFRLDADAFIDAMTKMVSSYSSPITHHSSLSLAFLCNPNNPTGLVMQRDEVLKIAAAAKKLRCYLVIDEAFIDFCPEHSVIDAAAHNPYLIVLRSMTKFYALAGIRLGYGVFPLSVARIIRALREPWTVSTVAQIAGCAALHDHGYRVKTESIIAREKQYLEKSLRSLGVPYLPSAANYYLLRLQGADVVVKTLAEAGILVRSCANFRGLDRSYVRIAVRSRRENIRFLKELTLCRH